MRKVIHKLRQQPEEVRRHILHVTTFVLAVILFFVWVYTLGINDKEVTTDNTPNPISAIGANITNGYNSLGGTE